METALIYNVTVKVDQQIADRWLDWLISEHIPEMISTGCFQSYQVVRLLEVDDSEGPTYAIQYRSESKADYNRYLELHANTMRERSLSKWGELVFAFRSIMEVVHGM
jgi:hypothetical protein